ncbi:MAG: SDR family NAD(P)-dependent oxidoreductase [Maricaulaceae bacterium]
MQPSNGKNVIITGVSSGIGQETVRCLAKRGYRVFGSVRKLVDADVLQSELGDRFYAMVFDVCDGENIKSAAAQAFKIIGDEPVTAIINNAGLALFGPMELLDDDAFEHIMKVNVIGTRLVTNAFLPLMRNGMSQVPRKIVNVSSLSGIFNTPMSGAYCVSKHAMESLGEIYRRELLTEQIDVVSIRSGPIQTEIWRKNIDEATPYDGTPYEEASRRTQRIMNNAKKKALPPSVISELILDIIEGRKNKLSYHVGVGSRVSRILSSCFAPKRTVDRLIYNALNKPKKTQKDAKS